MPDMSKVAEGWPSPPVHFEEQCRKHREDGDPPPLLELHVVPQLLSSVPRSLLPGKHLLGGFVLFQLFGMQRALTHGLIFNSGDKIFKISEVTAQLLVFSFHGVHVHIGFIPDLNIHKNKPLLAIQLVSVGIYLPLG